MVITRGGSEGGGGGREVEEIESIAKGVVHEVDLDLRLGPHHHNVGIGPLEQLHVL